jgi:hypothetical protein
MSTENHSEVARLRAQIDAEYTAAHLGLCGLAAGTACHAIINARIARMANYLKELREQGKEEEAKALLLSDDLWVEEEK